MKNSSYDTCKGIHDVFFLFELLFKSGFFIIQKSKIKIENEKFHKCHVTHNLRRENK